jgi:hypothetical protein
MVVSAKYIFENAGAILLGVPIATVVAGGVGLLWPSVRLPVFLVVLLWWVSAGVVSVIKDFRATDGGLLASVLGLPGWRSSVPPEFRFIDRDTTLQEVIDKLGPYTRETTSGEIKAFEYEVPGDGSVIVFAEWPFEPSSVIRGVQFCRKGEKIRLPA